MKNVLYIGNNLRNQQSNTSSIQVLGALLEKEGFAMYYASSKQNKVLRLLDMARSCISLSDRVDVVFIDTYSTLNFYYAVVVSQLCRVLKLPYIPILHGGNLPSRLADSPFLSNLVFKHAYKTVSPSLYMVEAFKEAGYEGVKYIPNSIEIEKYAFKERDFSDVRMLWVRSFSEIYNPCLAVRVLKQLQDAGVSASLCMVGPDADGSLEAVQQLAKDLQVSVRFTGKLPKEEWISLSEDYNVFINTTNFDNMPVSVIEAMALGLPVVSTNVGGMPYLITDKKDGLLVAPEDAAAFVGAIQQLVAHPEASREMALAARKKVEAFDWEVVKEEWVSC
ncbi:glycosyltransferase involved in cell wall biosynthesis [Oceanihabitans sediminis]|uniref:Glycosyltransferase n=1 Tax=Oceanihabitans sediminis TaxID=1812012 RepID=A0A368P2N8_9FLAO|nr:glycosyltransferase family 4 protein [Oceanihabitans sediminis]RBP27177.1 glycosyltransferase involved in cell wall biosynthesis [Oceanihabitans sediminis]RCU57092.1 glycosyltransferase [Oceanihabitans sediminis]